MDDLINYPSYRYYNLDQMIKTVYQKQRVIYIKRMLEFIIYYIVV